MPTHSFMHTCMPAAFCMHGELEIEVLVGHTRVQRVALTVAESLFEGVLDAI